MQLIARPAHKTGCAIIQLFDGAHFPQAVGIVMKLKLCEKQKYRIQYILKNTTHPRDVTCVGVEGNYT